MNGSILTAKFGNFSFCLQNDEEKNIITKLEGKSLYICVAHAKCRCTNDRKINIIIFIEIFMISGH